MGHRGWKAWIGIGVAGTWLAVWTGCAGTSLPAGDALLDTGDYAAAVTALQEEETARPDDPKVKRNLGVALLESGRTDAARAKLGEAAALAPDDPLVAYFQGVAAERAGDPAAAVEGFGRYMALSGNDPPVLRARIRELSRVQAEAEVRRAIAAEAQLAGRTFPANTVAVPGYTNVSESTDLAPLSRGLAVVLITDLNRVGSLRVLERERVQTLIDELDLAAPGAVPAGPVPPEAVSTTTGIKERLAFLNRAGSGEPYFTGEPDETRSQAFRDAVRAFQADAGLAVDGIPGPRTQQALDQAYREAIAALPAARPAAVDPSSAPRMGRLLGAGRLIQGSFSALGETSVQLDASVAEVNTGTLSPAGEAVTGPLPEVLRLQKQLTHEVLAALGIEVTDDEKRAIDKLPTESFDAFLAYSRGLDFEARGMTQEAIDAYRDALRLDPGFELAREQEEIATVSPGDRQSHEMARVEESLRQAPGGGTADRVIRTGVWVGLGPGPDGERTDAVDPSVTSVEKIDQATIVVEGDVPGRDQ